MWVAETTRAETEAGQLAARDAGEVQLSSQPDRTTHAVVLKRHGSPHKWADIGLDRTERRSRVLNRQGRRTLSALAAREVNDWAEPPAAPEVLPGGRVERIAIISACIESKHMRGMTRGRGRSKRACDASTSWVRQGDLDARARNAR